MNIRLHSSLKPFILEMRKVRSKVTDSSKATKGNQNKDLNFSPIFFLSYHVTAFHGIAPLSANRICVVGPYNIPRIIPVTVEDEVVLKRLSTYTHDRTTGYRQRKSQQCGVEHHLFVYITLFFLRVSWLKKRFQVIFKTQSSH